MTVQGGQQLQSDKAFMHIDEEDRKGRILVTWDDVAPEKGTPFVMSLTAFRSNVDEKRYFIALADWPKDDDDFDGGRSESTGYVTAKQAAMLSKAFADIAAKLS